MPLKQFRDAVEIVCSTNLTKGRSLRCDITGFDNRNFTVYIKKNDKGHTNRSKGGPAAKRSPKL